MEQLKSLTNGKIMIICFIIFAAVLIFPRLLRRRRIQKQIWNKKQTGEQIRPEDFTGNQKLFYTHNAQSSEIEIFLSKLKNHAFKHKMKIVFPGTFCYNDHTSSTTMILVGNFGLLLIRCYGFGGHIYTENNGKKFIQNMNEAKKEIINPLLSMVQEEDLMHLLLDQTDFRGIPISSASVFTRQGVILSVPENSHIFDRSHFLYWLETDDTFKKNAQVPVKELTDYLVDAVKKSH